MTYPYSSGDPSYRGPAQRFPGYPPSGQWGYPRPTNGMAVASMILGILWLSWLGSILALIFGYVARQQIRERGESGDGMAIAGIVLGWIGVGFAALFVGVFIFGMVGATVVGPLS